MARKKHPKRSGERFVALPHFMLNHEKFALLSGNATKLYIQLFAQYNGHNNGDFSCAFSIMKKKGWHSSGTLQKAINELIDAKFIVKTRQGGRNKCSLYGITLHGFDECKGKLDAGMANSNVFSGIWKQ